MGEASRTITIIVALATLSSNILSSILFHNLPDDPFHLARNLGWYLHFANLLSIFGLVGALREHALSIGVFANFLILDTISFSIPRFLVLGLLRSFSSSLCSSTSPLAAFSNLDIYTPHSQTSTSNLQGSLLLAPQSHISPLSHNPDLPYPNSQWDSFSSSWSHDGCLRIVALAGWTLAAAVVAGTLLQFVGALSVREYARACWVREMMEEEEFLSGIGGRWGRLDRERLVRFGGIYEDVEGERERRRLSVIREADEVGYSDLEKM